MVAESTRGLEPVRVDPDDVESRVVARVTRRLVPFMFLCYVVAYLDRVNIGFAGKDMQRDLGMDDAVFGLGGGLFFFGYFLFEIPSNLILERVGARRWMARIMIGWGLLSMLTMFVKGTASFYALRVLLGLAEAGFFPGMVLYLTYWVPAARRAKAGALFMMAAPIAIAVGSHISEALLRLDGALGLRGWQWLFLLEGLPAVVLGLLSFRFLTDRPEQAEWLAPADRAWLSGVMEEERQRRAALGHGSAFRALLDPKVALLCLIYFLNTVATYGLFLFLPKILAEASGFSGFRLSTITSIPFVFALVAMVLIGRHSDQTGERKWHVVACGATAGTGLVLASLSQHSVLLIVLSFTLSQVGQRAFQGVFWTIPPMFMGGTAAAASIAMINAVGNLGGFAGPSMVGWLRNTSASYTSGLLALAAGLLLQALLVATLRLPGGPEGASRSATSALKAGVAGPARARAEDQA